MQGDLFTQRMRELFSGSAFKDKSCRKDVLSGDALKDKSFREDLFSAGV